MAMRLLLILWFIFINKTVSHDQVCEVANVHVEHDDGSRQIFEVKLLEPSEDENCLTCRTNQKLDGNSRVTSLRSSVHVHLGELISKCESAGSDLPHGLCSVFKQDGYCTRDQNPCGHDDPSVLAEEIVSQGLVPMATGNIDIDKKIALGIVLINTGQNAEAVQEFTQITEEYPETVAAFYGRGVAYARKANRKENLIQSLKDFEMALNLDPQRSEIYERRAETYIAMGKQKLALDDLNKAIQLGSSGRLYFVRGVVQLVLESYTEAEEDFKRNLESDMPLKLISNFHLALAQYYRGKIRNSIEVFKEVLKIKPDHIEACSSLGQAFKELGNLRAANARFNQSLAINPNHTLTRQLRAGMYFYSGEPKKSMLESNNCLAIDPNNFSCEYLYSLSSIALGKFFQGIKSATKVMVRNSSSIKMSPEFLRAHYLREHARYLHSKLDSPLDKLLFDEDFDDEYRDYWAKQQPFKFKNTYKEQPGLQPEISDVTSHLYEDYPSSIQKLLCQAHKIGATMQVSSDGFTANKRLNLAMGLAAIHIAQILEAKWKAFKHNRGKSVYWKDIYSIAVQYRRLVDPEQPVLWLEKLPNYAVVGYRTEINFIKGPVMNVRVMQYFDLVFKLAKTMLEHYIGEGDPSKATLEEIRKTKTCDELLGIARKSQLNENGFLVSTQVPSTKHKEQTNRLDGSMIVLTEENHKVLFSVNLVNTKARTNGFSEELDFLLNQIQEDIRRTGLSKPSDVDSVVNLILTCAYYLYNLMPLTRGSSVVAYTVTLGLIMSVGKQVTGKIPSGKLLELEAILSGAPDAFILVTKQWMNVKRLNTSPSSYPKVSEVFPTVRTVIEALNVDTSSC